MSQPRLVRTDLLEAAEAELDAAGYAYREEVGGKHPRLIVDVNGNEETIILSGTPSDWRSVKNARAQVRRKIKAWNLEMEPRQMELVPVEDTPNFEMIVPHGGEIGGVSVQTVSARALHLFLRVGKDFSTWIKDRIEQYGFVEGVDFVMFDAAPQNGGAGNRGVRKEYAITIDMAKELSMVERNEMGRAARRYFIECERQLRAQPSGAVTVSGSEDAILDLIVAGNQDMLAAQSRSAQDVVEHVEGGKLAVLKYLKMYVRETLDGIVQYQADFRESTRRRDKAVATRLDKVEQSVTALLKLAEQPLLSRSFIFSDWYDHDRIYQEFFPGRHIPNRRFLSSAISKSLDAYCKKRQRGFDMQSRRIGGRNVNLWHKDSVGPWMKVHGHDMVRAHLAKNRKTDPVVVAFGGAR